MITKNELQPRLASALELKEVFFKREDLHPYGSHKGRSIPVMIDTYARQGHVHFAISSSGNAALAAAFHISKLNSENKSALKLDILVGQKISQKKLKKLEQFANENIRITMHDRPLQRLFTLTQENKIQSLRQSTDPYATVGYHDLADEILQIPNLRAVFIGTSSGTTAQGLLERFQALTASVEVHIVQTTSCHPIADHFVNDQVIDEISIADAIVDHTAQRKDIVIPLIEKSGGNAWIVSNEQIKSAQDISLKNTDITLSTNSALSVAGLMQAVYTGHTWDGSVLCVICGD